MTNVWLCHRSQVWHLERHHSVISDWYKTHVLKCWPPQAELALPSCTLTDFPKPSVMAPVKVPWCLQVPLATLGVCPLKKQPFTLTPLQG